MNERRELVHGLTVRDFRPADQDAVRTLIEDGLQEHWGEPAPGTKGTAGGSLNTDLHDLAAAYAEAGILVAVIAGQVVGCGIVRRHRLDEPARGDRGWAPAAEIVRMSVSTQHRGRHIGATIVDELVAMARSRGAERVVVETTASWTGVVRFYERCGFTFTHEADGPFGVDAWFELRL